MTDTDAPGPQRRLVIRPAAAQERDHERAVRPVLVILALQALVVAIVVIAGFGNGVAVVLVFPAEGFALLLVRRHYVRAARLTVDAGNLELTRPYLRDRRFAASSVDLVLLTGEVVSATPNPLLVEPSQAFVLGNGRKRLLLRLSGEMWQAERFVEIATALDARCEQVGRLSKREIHRQYGARPGIWAP